MMGDTITELGGTLEHFAGDGVMSSSTTPFFRTITSAHAVRMAATMREGFAAMCRQLAEARLQARVRRRDRRGTRNLGRVGFEGRHDYGAIGNVTILAARRGARRRGPDPAQPRVAAMVEDVAEVEEIGELQIKGLSRPVAATNVLGVVTPAASR